MTEDKATKIALVTGGNRGIGKDVAVSLSRVGIDVILTYHSNQREADNVVDEIRKLGGKAAAVQFDLSQTAFIDPFLDRLRSMLRNSFDTEKIDFLINNAGFGRVIPIEKLTEDDFDAFLNVHYKGVVFLTQKALSMMNDGGSVVCITAAGDRFHVPGYAVYSSCKGAIEVFSRYVAKEYGPRGIRANTVAPGGIETDFAGAIIRNTPALQEYIKTETALGRVGMPDDIGSVVAFLCSKDSKWVSGQRLEVTGGYRL